MRNFKFQISNFKLVRRGLTLIELMIVVSLMALLAAMVLPRLRPAMEGRRVREAARSIHIYLQSARATAIASGRSCGIMIDRLTAQPLCGMTICQVQTPLPYSGGDYASVAKVTWLNTDRNTRKATLTATVSGFFDTRLVAKGDRIQFNCQGPWYTITANPTGNTLNLEADLSLGQLVPWTNVQSKPIPYRILRRPVKAGATPFQLPAATVVDLQHSGPDGSPWAGTSTGTTTDPVLIVFSPNGGLDRLYNDAIKPTYLLIGKREQVDTKENLTDLSNLLIGINPQNGRVTTENIAAGGDPYLFVREGQNMGGR